MAAGAGLFSDGYLQSAIGPVNTCLKTLYPDQYYKHTYGQNITSIAFAGTVLGQLVRDVLRADAESDRRGRDAVKVGVLLLQRGGTRGAPQCPELEVDVRALCVDCIYDL